MVKTLLVLREDSGSPPPPSRTAAPSIPTFIKVSVSSHFERRLQLRTDSALGWNNDKDDTHIRDIAPNVMTAVYQVVQVTVSLLPPNVELQWRQAVLPPHRTVDPQAFVEVSVLVGVTTEDTGWRLGRCVEHWNKYLRLDSVLDIFF